MTTFSGCSYFLSLVLSAYLKGSSSMGRNRMVIEKPWDEILEHENGYDKWWKKYKGKAQIFAFIGTMADEVQNDVTDQVADIAPFDPTKKKKKKKVVLQDPTDEIVDKLAEKTESLSVSDGLETTTFSGLKKKKKKPVEASSLNEDSADATEDLEDQAGEIEDREGIVLQYRYPWEGTDRDYEYEEGRIAILVVFFDFLFIFLLRWLRGAKKGCILLSKRFWDEDRDEEVTCNRGEYVLDLKEH
ncbi:eukaryotic translation initiation factor 2 subunit beta [Cucumis melo var. makuwa]|uniref:Eukaryotic translation initiation factor 2 subunit beta n=1 Tax=Cucumis melo var. makuwa TaxID=1194695 RepID=A0A5A7VFQ3_CUCMM|nr:eukaryotic translation initiation factor 2 subunit beta [Cucumis melo var. makuwa]TYK15110.1 eukaryotic translation initiation factor 2 subunit beta [Cucumis melo var. makuwa]